jgi:hypothetical protein
MLLSTSARKFAGLSGKMVLETQGVLGWFERRVRAADVSSSVNGAISLYSFKSI